MDFASAPARLRVTPSWLIGQAAIRAQRLVSEELDALDARRYHYSVLVTLADDGPASQAALGRRCGIDRSDVAAVINELSDRSLVERGPDPADRRRNIVKLAPAGRHFLRRLDTRVARAQDRLLVGLDGAERDQLAKLLSRLVATTSS